MEATFKIDGCTRLRVGNDIQLPDSFTHRGYVTLLIEREELAITAAAPVTRTVLASLKPSEARALASAILSAATEAKESR